MGRSVLFRCVSGAVTTAVALATVVLATVLAPSAQASRAPVSLVAVDGFLTTASSSAPDLLVVNYSISVQGKSLTNAVITTKTFPDVPVDPATVQVDGVTVPSDTLTQSPRLMTIRLGTGANSTDGGSLGVGSYLVSYQQQRPTKAQSNAATVGTVTFNRDGTPGTASSDPIPLMHPDLSLSIPARSGEDTAAYLGTGRVAAYGAYLRNHGATADAATLTITLPAGLRLDFIDGVLRFDLTSNGGQVTPLKCTHPATSIIRCPVGEVVHHANIGLLIPLVAAKGAKPGTRGKFTVNVAPVGEPDQNPSDNSLTGKVRFTGIARLHTEILARTTRVQVGKTLPVRLHITNNGPQPASFTFGVVIVAGKHFVITKLTTKRHPKRRPVAQPISIPPGLGSIIEWNAGKIAPHTTAYARIIVKAKSVGSSRLQFFASSVAGDPGCDRFARNCRAISSLRLHAVKKVVKTKGATAKLD
jgi:hypothetical protein